MTYVWLGLLGLVMGLLAGLVLRGDYHFVTDSLLGIAGALIGGHLYLTYLASWGNPNIGSLVFGAIGAGVALMAWRSMRSVD